MLEQKNELLVKVIDVDGQECHNLWGVFRHRLPIAFNAAVRTGETQYVDYAGQPYRIVRAEN